MDFDLFFIDEELELAHAACTSAEAVAKGPGRPELQDWYANVDRRTTTPLPAAGEQYLCLQQTRLTSPTR